MEPFAFLFFSNRQISDHDCLIKQCQTITNLSINDSKCRKLLANINTIILENSQYLSGNDIDNEDDIMDAEDSDNHDIDNNNDENERKIFCICGQEFVKSNTSEISGSMDVETIICDKCDNEFIASTEIEIYHCPRDECSDHPYGYDLCKRCSYLTQ